MIRQYPSLDSLYLLGVAKAQREQRAEQRSKLAELRARLDKIEATLGEQPRRGTDVRNDP